MVNRLRYELIVPAQVENLALIGDFITSVARRVGLSEKQVFEVQLATDEACTNVIEHAYRSAEGSVHIVCLLDEDGLEVQIHDTGDSFDPEKVTAPNLDAPLEDRNMGGLGLHFMRSVMDEVRFEFNQHGNHLRMIKRKRT